MRYISDARGKLIKEIKIPERPTSIVISNDDKTLYITSAGRCLVNIWSDIHFLFARRDRFTNWKEVTKNILQLRNGFFCIVVLNAVPYYKIGRQHY